MCLLIDEHGRKGHFGAGPGSGRDHDLGHARFLDLAQTEIFFRLAAVGDKDTHRLGNIHCRSAAGADHAVASRLLGHAGAFIGKFQTGLRVDLVIDLVRYGGSIKRCGNLVHKARCLQTWVNDQKYLFGPERLDHVSQFQDNVFTKMNTGGLINGK